MSKSEFNILVLAGDGIGPEVMRQARRILDRLASERETPRIQLDEDLVGGASLEIHGRPVTDAVMEKAHAADAILFGAVGGPAWDEVPFESKPERGLLRLRKELNLFANLRPAQTFAPLIGASTLKPEVISGLDIMIVRELTGGVYFGEPRGIVSLPNGERRGVNTQTYTSTEIRRVARVAFELARKRKRKVISADKANVMESGLLWREEVTILGRTEFPDVELGHMYADNLAMQLLRNPRQFDVIVTDNLFGDILSDEAAMLTGSLGMLPSAALGARTPDGRQPGMYEPIHGSAPDIAGQNKANPIAMILSLAMAMRYSLGLEDQARRIEQAVETALASGLRTPDIMQEGGRLTSTAGMGDAILGSLQ